MSTPDLKSLLATKADAFEKKLPEPFPARLDNSGVQETSPELRIKRGMPEYQGFITWEPLTWKTKTGNPMPDYFRLTDNRDSKMFRLLSAFQAVKGVYIDSLAELAPYYGRAFSVQRTPIENNRGAEIGSYIRALALLSDEEVQAAQAEYAARQATQPQAAAPTMGVGIDDDTALIRLIGEGIPAADEKRLITEVRRRLTQAADLKADPALASRVIDGSLIREALADGRLGQVDGPDGNPVFVLATAVVAVA